VFRRRRRRRDGDADRAQESLEDRAERYLLEGRLIVSFVDRGIIRAVCEGDRRLYELGYERDWWCGCSNKGPCAHLIALQTVTDPRAPGTTVETPHADSEESEKGP
jgi:hypothetical protein